MYSTFLVLLGISLVVFCEGFRTTTSSPRSHTTGIAFPDDLHVHRRNEEFYHRPQHGPGYHNSYSPHKEYSESENRGHGSSYVSHYNKNPRKQIPLDFIRDVNNLNVSDLLLNWVDDDDYDEGTGIQNRFGEAEEEERNAAIIPKDAACMPELTTVKIVTSDDPSILYIPQCTRIERCGGCCSHALLSCQPQETESVVYKVIKTQYTGAKKLKLVAKEVIAVERHTKCKCDCRIQAEDCNRFQVYNKPECRCSCINIDEEKKCLKSNSTKLWNPELCACQCREVPQCSTGSIFDPSDCRCVRMPLRRRYATYDNRKEPPPPPEPSFFGDD